MREQDNGLDFGTGGIRDAFERFHPLMAFSIANAFCNTSKKTNSAAIAWDGRVSCVPLYRAATAGILASGKNSIDLGVCPTPALAYYTQMNSELGIMITASHNPLSYVGMKFFSEGIEDSHSFSAVAWEKSTQADWKTVGEAQRTDFAQQYCRDAIELCSIKEKHSVFIDCAGLCCSLYVPRAMGLAGAELNSTNTTLMCAERELEPKAENLGTALKIAATSDIGFAYDGDGDRCRVILGGKVLSEEQQLLLMAYYMIRYGKAERIVSTVESSTSLKKMAESLGAKLVITPVGSANIGRIARERGCGFGGEPCGEYVFPEFHHGADGIFTSLKFLELIERVDWKRVIEEFDTFAVAREKLRPNDKEKVMQRILENPAKALGLGMENIESIGMADGVRIVFKNHTGFVLVRKSGTEDVLRITVEAQSREQAEELCRNIGDSITELEK